MLPEGKEFFFAGACHGKRTAPVIVKRFKNNKMGYEEAIPHVEK